MEQMENESGTRGLARDLAAMRCYATDTDPWTTKHNRSTAICTAAMQQAAGCACADEGRMPTLEGLESQDTDHAQRRHPLLRTAPSCPRQRSSPACAGGQDRKSTRLNSSHLVISYAVFCLKKKKTQKFDTCQAIRR